MNFNDQFAKNYRKANAFLNIFERLLTREEFELETTEIGFLFEVVASNILPGKIGTFDGATGLYTKIRKSKQVEFVGKMWIIGNKTDRLETLIARVTDKRMTKQGIWIKIQVGDEVAESDLSEAFDLPESFD